MQPFRICCFGDSNTFGYIPGSGGRLEYGERWPGVLANTLGSPFEVIEEGKNGRTTVFSDKLRPGKNGLKSLPKILARWSPIDLLIIMLGTNDLKDRMDTLPTDVAGGMAQVCSEAQSITAKHRGEPSSILVVCPPKYRDCPALEVVFKRNLEASAELAGEYAKICKELDVRFFDANEVIACSETDGVHIDAAAHQSLASALADEVRAIYSERGV